MNKLVKGAVATAAGVALLMGGAGTFALWNTSASVSAGAVASGTLTIATNGAGTWKDISADRTATAIPTISSWKIVPGDKLEFTQNINVVATGNNLLANLSYDPATIVAATGQASLDLKSKLVVTITATGTGVTTNATTGVITVAPSAATIPVAVKVTVELPSTVGDAVGESSIAQNGSVSLATLSLKLNQTR
ncbi:alternate-type signal peptide domain-containing protein [Salinibacterium sp.]|uniref:alternate-type signal peptide domain-containing protein n=1 Tax=Salinibacterium sp. TaxID=1915057 RepID=UPI00286A59D6|nr:alternate-type signal peptide domain-containing protein [Salinibacterium sp.]